MLTAGLRPLVPTWYIVLMTRRSVLSRAAAISGYTRAQLCGASRDAALCRVRWAIMLAMQRRGNSLNETGRLLGDRDHTTIMHGINRAKGIAAADPDYAALVATLADKVE